MKICLNNITRRILLLQTKYLKADGSPMLHVVKECPRHYYLTYITRKDWPFLPKFNKILIRLAEGGFTKFWHDSTANTLIQRAYLDRNNYSAGQAFSLNHVKMPFYILLFGYALSIIVFLGERLSPMKLENIRKALKLSSNNGRTSNSSR